MKGLKISELIDKLEAVKKEKGDLQVIMHTRTFKDFTAVDCIESYAVHPDDIANQEQGKSYKFIDSENINCVILS